MPLGIVDDSEYEADLDDKSQVKAIVIDKPIPGRKQGDKNVPPALRSVISAEVLENGRSAGVALAESFGVSPSSVSAYSNGATSTKTYDTKDEELVRKNNRIKQVIAGKATKKLEGAIDAIEFSEVKPRVAAAIAKDMAAVVKTMEPENDVVKGNGPTVIFYSPQQKSEDFYEVVNSQE